MHGPVEEKGFKHLKTDMGESTNKVENEARCVAFSMYYLNINMTVQLISYFFLKQTCATTGCNVVLKLCQQLS